MVLCPPQHGKTSQVTHRYPVWSMIRQAGLRALIAAHTQDYANKLSRECKRVAANAGVKLAGVEREKEWELANGSSLYAVGIGGPLTGRSVDLAVIDDPVKSREEADSEAFRERVWEWYLDDFTTRLQENACVAICMTPWHQDDLAGRILASPEASKWTVLKLPAIAEEGEIDPLGRLPGEPLCPERFTLQTLQERQAANPEGFTSLYQLNPVPRGGLFFERQWFEIVYFVPDDDPDIRRVRAWDLAATKGQTSCFTAGVLLAFSPLHGKVYVEDVVRGRWAPAERNSVIRQTAEMDANRVNFQCTYFEEQPGGSGVETTDYLISKMIGLPVRADRVTGDKVTRAIPFSDFARGNGVRVLKGDWNAAYLGELASFPRGMFKDQVDSTSAAFARVYKSRGTILWS